jgi:hypothetical protein
LKFQTHCHAYETGEEEGGGGEKEEGGREEGGGKGRESSILENGISTTFCKNIPVAALIKLNIF